MSDGWRSSLVGSLLAGMLSLSPGSVPAWRWDLRNRPIAVLMVGEPTPSLAARTAADPR